MAGEILTVRLERAEALCFQLMFGESRTGMYGRRRVRKIAILRGIQRLCISASLRLCNEL